MTQQSLITRLKAVEEALDHSMPNVIGDLAYHTRKHNAALSDLRELIKEAEGQAYRKFVWSESPLFDDGVMKEMPPHATGEGIVLMYRALGEKP